MPSLIRSVTRLARSPQGRQALEKAKTAATDPKNKEKATEVIGRVRSGVSASAKALRSERDAPEQASALEPPTPIDPPGPLDGRPEAAGPGSTAPAPPRPPRAQP